MNENKREVIENPEPDWSLGMFWEDITFILKKIGEVIEAIIKSFKGE